MACKVPWDWQVKAVAAYAWRKIAAFVVDCGCGKTFAGILVALKKAMPVIVIAPTHRLCEQWKEAIEEASSEADVWVYNRSEETKQGDYYKERFEEWLTKT
jgi:superfamily II DNA or RNA helicase